MRGAFVKAGACLGTAVAAVVLVVGGGATPAWAHAQLLSTAPASGEQLKTPPRQVVITFNETVDPPGDAIEVFGSDGKKVDATKPTHPGGVGAKISVDLPHLDDGTYVVTWKVASADSHPIRGAYTFRVGNAADSAKADALMTRLVASEGGDTTVGTLFGAVRFLGFVGMMLLVGGLLFVTFVWPGGADNPRARRLTTAGWAAWVVATLLSFGFQAAYSEGDGLGGIVKTSSIGDVLGTRPGRVWLARLLLLALVGVGAVLLRRRRPAAEAKPRSLTRAAPGPTAGLVVLLCLALVSTISLAGHAGTGDLAPLAFVVDLFHLSAVSFWVGGLTLLFVVVLRRPAGTVAASTVGAAAAVVETEAGADAAAVAGAEIPGDDQAAIVGRFSTLALAAVVVIVVSGSIQGWRQTRGWDALFDTTYGRVLIVKVSLFTVMLVAAAASRAWVRRRNRAAAATAGGPTAPSLRGLRLSVGIETAVAALVLGVTALLVNTVPGKDAVSPTATAEVHGNNVLVDVEVAPPKAGQADIRIDVKTHLGKPYKPQGVTSSLALPSRDIPAIPLTLKSTGTGLYAADNVEIPYPGVWTLSIKVRVSEFDEDDLEAQIPVK